MRIDDWSSDVCSSDLTVHSRDSVRAVVHLRARRHIGAVPVLDADGALVGIFTERDVMCRVVGRDLDPAGTSVADVMTPSPATAAPDWPILRALRSEDRRVRK